MSDDFDQVDSGASQTFPAQCSSLRKGGHVVINGFPCKIVDMSTSKTGKHGHAKIHMVGIDIFTGKKYEDLCPSTHNMNVPNVKRIDYQLIDIDGDGFCSLLSTDGTTTKNDLKLPTDETGVKVKSLFDSGVDVTVTVQSALDTEMIIDAKESTKSNK